MLWDDLLCLRFDYMIVMCGDSWCREIEIAMWPLAWPGYITIRGIEMVNDFSLSNLVSEVRNESFRKVSLFPELNLVNSYPVVVDEFILGSWFIAVEGFQLVSTCSLKQLLFLDYWDTFATCEHCGFARLVPLREFCLVVKHVSFVRLVFLLMKVLCCKFFNMWKLWLYVILLDYSKCWSLIPLFSGGRC